MNRPARLAAALVCALAVPALAGVPETPAPSAGPEGSPPKHDFTKRPELRPYAPREKTEAGKPLSEKQAKALAQELFDNYLNISGLSLFRFYHRSPDQPPMPLEDMTWADEGLARELKLADKLQAEADAALKAGIERRVPPPGDRRIGRANLIFKRAKFARRFKPTLDELRRDEAEAASAIGLSLYSILREESEPADEADPQTRDEADKALAEGRADLTKARQEILGFREELKEREELGGSGIIESKERIKRTVSGSFGDRGAPVEGPPPGPIAPPPPVQGPPRSVKGTAKGRGLDLGSRAVEGTEIQTSPAEAQGLDLPPPARTVEQAIEEANSAPRAPAPRKARSIVVPAP